MKGLQLFFRLIDPHRFSRSFLNLRPASGGRNVDPEERNPECFENISNTMIDETLGEWLFLHNPPVNPLSSRMR